MKRFLTVLLTFTLYFNLFTNAHAASLGGWSLGNPIANGASAVVNGTKTAIINGASVIKNSTAKITPPASSVAKVLAKGGAGYALSVAVEQLLGSVDWVLDPANNRIVYTEPSDPSQPSNSYPLFYYSSGYPGQYGTLDAAINAAIERWNESPNAWGVITGVRSKTKISDYQYKVDVRYKNYPDWVAPIYIDIAVNPNYDPEATDEQKSIPLETVAKQVISNAASGDSHAQQAIVAAAQDIINEAETDNTKARPIVNQLEANAETATDETATGEAVPKADPVTGEQAPPTDISLEFPKFCTWAPTICEAAQTVITFPNTLTEWWETANSKAEEWALSISEAWTAAKEWAKPEQQDDTELDIPEQEQPEIDTDIAFGGSCPSDREAEVNMGVGIIKLPISYEPICTTVSTAKPVLIFVGFFIAALIIGGVKSE